VQVSVTYATVWLDSWSMAGVFALPFLQGDPLGDCDVSPAAFGHMTQVC